LLCLHLSICAGGIGIGTATQAVWRQTAVWRETGL